MPLAHACAVLFNTFDIERKGYLDVTDIQGLVTAVGDSAPTPQNHFRAMIYASDLYVQV